jgi:hypothetical protein
MTAVAPAFHNHTAYVTSSSPKFRGDWTRLSDSGDMQKWLSGFEDSTVVIGTATFGVAAGTVVLAATDAGGWWGRCLGTMNTPRLRQAARIRTWDDWADHQIRLSPPRLREASKCQRRCAYGPVEVILRIWRFKPLRRAAAAVGIYGHPDYFGPSCGFPALSLPDLGRISDLGCANIPICGIIDLLSPSYPDNTRLGVKKGNRR